MNRITANAMLSEQITVNVYDPEKKELIATYDSMAIATRKLGIGRNVIRRMFEQRNRAYSPILKKEVACRVAKKEQTLPS